MVLSWVRKELLPQVGDSKYLEVLLTSAAIEERDSYIERHELLVVIESYTRINELLLRVSGLIFWS